MVVERQKSLLLITEEKGTGSKNIKFWRNKRLTSICIFEDLGSKKGSFIKWVKDVFRTIFLYPKALSITVGEQDFKALAEWAGSERHSELFAASLELRSFIYMISRVQRVEGATVITPDTIKDMCNDVLSKFDKRVGIKYNKPQEK